MTILDQFLEIPTHDARYHRRMSPFRIAVVAQLIGALIAVAFTELAYPTILSMPLPWASLQGLCAALVSRKLGAPSWWLPIHLAFLPIALFAMRLDIPPAWWLGGFLLLFLMFWRTDRDRVPLYLSNRRTAQAVLSLLPPQPCNFIDLGCGTGSMLKHLARSRPDCSFEGIEHAPLPFFYAWLRALGVTNLNIRYGNFWKQDLSTFDFAYAFLSPQPMPQLWHKACAEMRPGSLLVSNSFDIPDAPHDLIQVPDRRRTQLYCYSPAGS